MGMDGEIDASRPAEGEGLPRDRSLVRGPEGSIARQASEYSITDYAVPRQNEEEGLASTIRQFTHIALKRKWLIVAFVAAFSTLGAVRTFLKTPLFMANVRVQIDRNIAKIVDNTLAGQASEEDYANDFLKTQYELLKSHAIAERVASSLHLAEDAGFLKPRSVSLLTLISGPAPSQPSSEASRQEAAAGIVQNNVIVLPVAGSRLVDISYVDTSPLRAKQIADGYADAYIAANLDKRFVANSYAKSFLEDRIKQLKIRLEESEKALLNFAEREKMVEVTDKTSITENNLAAANAAAGVLISERIKNEQLWLQAEKTNAINLPQLLSNSVIDTLRGQRKALETEYQEKLEHFKPGYPVMVQISNKIKEVDRQLAAEVATIRNSLKAAYDSSLAQENQMKARIETLRSGVLELQKKGIQYDILKREAETNRGLYNSLLQRYKEVDIAGGAGTNNVFIVDRAQVPASSFEPNVSRSLLLSLALGLGAGAGLAFLLETIDDSIRTPEEIEQLAGLTTLGIIPKVEADVLNQALLDPRSGICEAYRSLATALQFSTESGLPKTITITSAGPSEGKSVTALAIARYFAQVGLRVLLVDADLRRPSLHTKLDLSNTAGLSNYLTGASMPPELVQKTSLPNLAFLASGPLPPNAADLLSGTRLFSLIALGSEVFDLIVFDCPPVLGIADAQLLGSASAATIFAVGAGSGGKSTIRSALQRLQLARITPIGAVLTKFDEKLVGYSYAYKYAYRGYGYRSYGYGQAYSYAPLEPPEKENQIEDAGGVQ
jgi:capsular exopolysaccharide synthesis family protein